MEDLHEFPFVETTEKGIELEEFKQAILETLGLSASLVRKLPNVKHTFTKYRVHLMPVEFETKALVKLKGYEWVIKEQLDQLAFSSGHRKIYHVVKSSG